MTKTRNLLSLALLGLAVALQPARAAINIDITQGAEAAIPVAVVPFVLEGGGTPPPEDVAGIITNDLRRSGKFEPLPTSDMLSRPSRFDDVQFQQWKALGVDAMVVGAVEQLPSGEYQVRFELLDTYKTSRILGKYYRVPATALRALAHNIADQIHEALTGQPGAFSSQIVFVQQVGTPPKRSFQLVLADADGHGQQVILTSPQPLMAPSWSPDRRQIAYVSFENRRQEVFVQSLSTGERRVVAKFRGLNNAPVWSPDGRRLALTLSKDGNPDIYVLDLDTGALRAITQHWSIDTEPSWSPDGRTIYFTSDRGGKAQIYRVSANGGQAERVTFEGNYNAHPVVSPDGRWLAMVHRGDNGDQIAVMDLQTKQLRTLTRGPLDESPSFAPNSAMLIYTANSGGASRLATVSVFGRADLPVGLIRNPVREAAWSPR